MNHRMPQKSIWFNMWPFSGNPTGISSQAAAWRKFFWLSEATQANLNTMASSKQDATTNCTEVAMNHRMPQKSIWFNMWPFSGNPTLISSQAAAWRKFFRLSGYSLRNHLVRAYILCRLILFNLMQAVCPLNNKQDRENNRVCSPNDWMTKHQNLYSSLYMYIIHEGWMNRKSVHISAYTIDPWL